MLSVRISPDAGTRQMNPNRPRVWRPAVTKARDCVGSPNYLRHQIRVPESERNTGRLLFNKKQDAVILGFSRISEF